MKRNDVHACTIRTLDFMILNIVWQWNHKPDKTKNPENVNHDMLWTGLMHASTKSALWNKWKINDTNKSCDKSTRVHFLFVQELILFAKKLAIYLMMMMMEYGVKNYHAWSSIVTRHQLKSIWNMMISIW